MGASGYDPDTVWDGPTLKEIIEAPNHAFVVKDSGKRQEFETGSRRDTREGKGRFDLLPTLPMRELAIHYEQGAAKYGDHNWKKGQPLMRYVDSAMRHINALVAGEDTENHAIAAAWNMFSYRWTLNEIEAGRLPASLDDRPEPEPRYAKNV
jgi:hypothetical protein